MGKNCRGMSQAARGIAVAMVGLLALNGPAALAASGESSATKVSGVVSIASDPPGANVYLDGQFAGQTPLRVNALANGDHRVRLVKDGYLENGRIVTVNTTNPQNVQVTLTRRSGANAEATAQVSGGGGGGGSKKWLYIGAAGGGAAVAGIYLATRNKPPVPGAVTVSPTATGMAGVTSFSFTSNASDPNNDTLTYTWDFGDGGTGSGATPTHTYSNAGTFNVKLSVSDGKASADATGVSVTVARSITSTWTGGTEPGFSCPTNVALTQSGGTLSGAMLFTTPCSGSIPITSGTVNPLTHPSAITFTSGVWVANSDTQTFPGLTTTFSGTTDAAGNVLTGTIRTTQASSGATNAATTTFRR
jgi:PKD domain-containing protein/PEGA domain-containing protein